MINEILNIDVLEGMKKISDNSVDLIVTDLPYLIDYKTNRRKDKSHKFTKVIANDNNPQLIKDYIKECYRIMKDNTAMFNLTHLAPNLKLMPNVVTVTMSVTC